MKKKKEPKKANMPEISFKQFTPEEDRVYEEAVGKFREAIAAGRKLREAYESYAIADGELRAIIQADFLKILIAERHFSKREALEQIAADLGVAVDLVRETYGRMMQEVGVTAGSQFGKEHGTLAPDAPTTND